MELAKYNKYKAVSLCTPVTPFTLTGDAAYRQHAGGPSCGYGQHAQKSCKDRRCTVVPGISRQTHRLLITILRMRSRGRSKLLIAHTVET